MYPFATLLWFTSVWVWHQDRDTNQSSHMATYLRWRSGVINAVHWQLGIALSFALLDQGGRIREGSYGGRHPGRRARLPRVAFTMCVQDIKLYSEQRKHHGEKIQAACDATRPSDEEGRRSKAPKLLWTDVRKAIKIRMLVHKHRADMISQED